MRLREVASRVKRSRATKAERACSLTGVRLLKVAVAPRQMRLFCRSYLCFYFSAESTVLREDRNSTTNGQLCGKASFFRRSDWCIDLASSASTTLVACKRKAAMRIKAVVRAPRRLAGEDEGPSLAGAGSSSRIELGWRWLDAMPAAPIICN